MGVAAILIANTIRLTVFARRREIAIMQLVGAENSYIRLPFILEGLLEGLIGAALALGALAVARHALLPKLADALPFIPFHVATIDEWSFALSLLSIGALGRGRCFVVLRGPAPERMTGAARRTAAFGAAVLAAAMCAPAAQGSDLDSKIKQQQAQLHAAHEKLQDKRSELGAAKIKVESLRTPAR